MLSYFGFLSEAFSSIYWVTYSASYFVSVSAIFLLYFLTPLTIWSEITEFLYSYSGSLSSEFYTSLSRPDEGEDFF